MPAANQGTTTMKTKIVLLAAMLAATAGYLGACVDQPNAGCPVLTPFWAKYEIVDAGTGCGKKKGELVGFQKYHPPSTNDYKLAFRFDGIGTDWDNGRSDPNDPDGKKVNGFAKITEFPAADHFCDVTDFVAPEETWDKLPDVTEDDGGITPGDPQQFKRYDWQKLRVLATVNAPGTILTGKLAYTEDTCHAVWNVTGIWPPTQCDPANNDDGSSVAVARGKGYNIDCDPKPVTIEDYKDALADGGLKDGGEPNLSHLLGSGLNPTFAPVGKPITCGPGGFCEPQLTPDEISKL